MRGLLQHPVPPEEGLAGDPGSLRRLDGTRAGIPQPDLYKARYDSGQSGVALDPFFQDGQGERIGRSRSVHARS